MNARVMLLLKSEKELVLNIVIILRVIKLTKCQIQTRISSQGN